MISLKYIESILACHLAKEERVGSFTLGVFFCCYCVRVCVLSRGAVGWSVM